MKNLFLSAVIASMLVAGYSCKGKDKSTDATTTTTPTNVPPEEVPAATAPVEVSNDETLRKGVTDATKDIKGLTTRVENGIIYLSGAISRDDNMRITPTLSSLRPKSINRDNLTIK